MDTAWDVLVGLWSIGPFISSKIIQTKAPKAKKSIWKGRRGELKEKSPLGTTLEPVCERGEKPRSPTAITIAHEN